MASLLLCQEYAGGKLGLGRRGQADSLLQACCLPLGLRPWDQGLCPCTQAQSAKHLYGGPGRRLLACPTVWKLMPAFQCQASVSGLHQSLRAWGQGSSTGMHPMRTSLSSSGRGMYVTPRVEPRQHKQAQAQARWPPLWQHFTKKQPTNNPSWPCGISRALYSASETVFTSQSPCILPKQAPRWRHALRLPHPWAASCAQDLLEVFRGRRLLGSETTTFPMYTQSNSSLAAWLPVCA